jgi:hypothetical protein
MMSKRSPRSGRRRSDSSDGDDGELGRNAGINRGREGTRTHDGSTEGDDLKKSERGVCNAGRERQDSFDDDKGYYHQRNAGRRWRGSSSNYEIDSGVAKGHSLRSHDDEDERVNRRRDDSPPTSVHVVKLRQDRHLNYDTAPSDHNLTDDEKRSRVRVESGAASVHYSGDANSDRDRFSDAISNFSGYHSTGGVSDGAESLGSNGNHRRHDNSGTNPLFGPPTNFRPPQHDRVDSRSSVGSGFDRQSYGSGASMSANASVGSLPGADRDHKRHHCLLMSSGGSGLGRGNGGPASNASDDPYEDLARTRHGRGHGHGMMQHHHHSNAGSDGMSIAALSSVTGESRFPHALHMSSSSQYGSEAAKSDIATVCSGSVMDEMEVASVLSGDLNQGGGGESVDRGSYDRGTSHNAPLNGSHPGPAASGRELASALYSASSSRRMGPGGSQLAVDFALAPSQHLHHPADIIHHNGDIADACGRGIGTLNDMGPPLSRVLLGKDVGSGPGSDLQSHASSGGAASDEGQPPDETKDRDALKVENGLKNFNPKFGVSRPRNSLEPFSRRSTSPLEDGYRPLDSQHSIDPLLKSDSLDGLKNGLHHEPSDPLERMVHGNEIPLTPVLTSLGLLDPEKVVASLREVSQSVNGSSGRVSPGGTIYKGRGTRRYQGRYMHLPLKRFHQNSTGNGLQDAYIPSGACVDSDGNNSPSMHHYEDDGPCPPARGRSRSRSWSRSRSRSPPSKRLMDRRSFRRGRSRSPCHGGHPSPQPARGAQNSDRGSQRSSVGCNRSRSANHHSQRRGRRRPQSDSPDPHNNFKSDYTSRDGSRHRGSRRNEGEPSPHQKRSGRRRNRSRNQRSGTQGRNNRR